MSKGVEGALSGVSKGVEVLAIDSSSANTNAPNVLRILQDIDASPC